MASTPLHLLVALPLPPSEHPFRTLVRPAAAWYRVHNYDVVSKRFGAAAFNDSNNGDARFSPLIDPASGNVIPTIYAAQRPEGAISEVVLHDVPTPSTGHLHDWTRDKASNLHMSQIGLPDLELVDLQSQGLQAAGLEVWELFGTNMPDYARTRKWAVHIWQSMPSAQGLLWMSRRENEGAVIMLFGDRIPAGTVTVNLTPKPIAEFENIVLGILDRLGCGIS